MEYDVTCRIDFNVNDNSRSVVAFLERLKPVLTLGPGKSWCIDLSACRYLGPDAATLLYSIWLGAKESEQTTRVLLPEEPPPLKAFCHFSNLAYLLGHDQPSDPSHPKAETVPLRQFSDAKWSEPNAIIDLVRRHVDFSADQEDYLRICMNEVIQNIEDHAKSMIGGVWCARFIASQDEVRVAIVDSGVGIFQTLSKHYPEISNASGALKRVFEGHYSSKSHNRNMGIGISNLAKIVTYSQGDLCIFSGNGIADLRSGRTHFRETDTPFGGTAVFFTLSTKDTAEGSGG